MPYPLLEQEHEQDPEMNWITLAVRMKLDLAGLKLGLRDWQKLPIAQRRVLHDAPVESEQEIARFGRMLDNLLRQNGCAAAQPLPQSKRTDVERWNQAATVPREVTACADAAGVQLDWMTLGRFTRYVLWTLAKKGSIERFSAAADELITRSK